MEWSLVVAALACATLFCGMWWLGVRGRLLDVPGARSLHLHPTPTGGGAGIVAALACVAVPAAPGAGSGVGDSGPLLLALAGLLCITGLIDDLRGLGVWTRLIVQSCCAAVVVMVLMTPASPALLGLLAWFCITGFINAFNFMDGIDGLAATHAAFAGFAGALLVEDQTAHAELVFLLSMTGACAAGFLVWNWPPARLFMGDAGSLPLGFLLAALALLAAQSGALDGWCWLILWAPFLCDAGITLVLRAVARKPLFRAHREHAYQRLAERGHRRVTAGLLLIDIVWLFPLAYMAQHSPAHAPLVALVALLPFAAAVLVVAARHRKAHEASA